MASWVAKYYSRYFLWRYFVDMISQKEFYLKTLTEILSEIPDCWPTQNISDQNCNMNCGFNFSAYPVDFGLVSSPNHMSQWFKLFRAHTCILFVLFFSLQNLDWDTCLRKIMLNSIHNFMEVGKILAWDGIKGEKLIKESKTYEVWK